MNLSGKHFEYAGKPSTYFGYDFIFAHIESEPLLDLAGKTNLQTTYNQKSKKRYINNIKYDESPLSFEHEIISEDPIDRNDLRKIENWLFCQNDFKPLYVARNEDVDIQRVNGEFKRSYLNCKFTNASKIEYGDGIHGWKITVECDSHMAWQEPITKVVTKFPNGIFKVDVDTDNGDYIYPVVQILTGETGGDISIANQTDDNLRLMAFEALPENTEIKLDGEINYVSPSYIDMFTRRNFIRLLPGENIFTITGDIASLTLTWQNMRYYT